MFHSPVGRANVLHSFICRNSDFIPVIKKREAKIPKTPGPKKRGLVQPSTPKPLKTQDSFCCPTKISRVRFETDDNYSFDLDNEAETSAASSTSSSNTTNRSLIDVVDARSEKEVCTDCFTFIHVFVFPEPF